MNFIVGPKRYDKNDALYLGEGREGESYLVEGLVVKKLFPFPSKLYLQEEDVKRLKDLKTTILDHPVTIATDEKNIILDLLVLILDLMATIIFLT